MTQYKTVAELLEKPERWTQSAFARDEDDVEVPSCDESAVCWCVMGAINVIWNSFWKGEQARERLRDLVGWEDIDDWNDAPERTHQEVLEAVRKAGI